MNLDLILLLVFVILLGILMYIKREKVVIEKIAFPLIYIVMYKTKIGLDLMDSSAKKFPRFTKVFGFLSIIFGFLTMIIIFITLTIKVYDFLFNGATTPLAPLLPGIQTVPGIPILGFWHWIISIFILATVHEFSHGWLARSHNIKVKSSGFAVLSVILPIIPAAFVEPDEKQLNNSPKRKQLEVLAAGSFSNYVTSAIFLLLLLFIISPSISSIIHSEGVFISGIKEGYPANLSGVIVGEEIVKVNNKEINKVEDFLSSLENVKPGDEVNLITNLSSYTITATNPPKSFLDKITFWREERGYLGIIPSPINPDFRSGFGILGNILSWIGLLFYWLFTINLAVGMINMLPLGPIDGGKMFLVASNFFLKNEEKARKLWIFVSVFSLALIVVSLMPFILKLLNFMLEPLISLLL